MRSLVPIQASGTWPPYPLQDVSLEHVWKTSSITTVSRQKMDFSIIECQSDMVSISLWYNIILSQVGSKFNVISDHKFPSNTSNNLTDIALHSSVAAKAFTMRVDTTSVVASLGDNPVTATTSGVAAAASTRETVSSRMIITSMDAANSIVEARHVVTTSVPSAHDTVTGDSVEITGNVTAVTEADDSMGATSNVTGVTEADGSVGAASNVTDVTEVDGSVGATSNVTGVTEADDSVGVTSNVTGVTDIVTSDSMTTIINMTAVNDITGSLTGDSVETTSNLTAVTDIVTDDKVETTTKTTDVTDTVTGDIVEKTTNIIDVTNTVTGDSVETTSNMTGVTDTVTGDITETITNMTGVSVIVTSDSVETTSNMTDVTDTVTGDIVETATNMTAVNDIMTGDNEETTRNMTGVTDIVTGDSVGTTTSITAVTDVATDGTGLSSNTWTVENEDIMNSTETAEKTAAAPTVLFVTDMFLASIIGRPGGLDQYNSTRARGCKEANSSAGTIGSSEKSNDTKDSSTISCNETTDTEVGGRADNSKDYQPENIFASLILSIHLRGRDEENLGAEDDKLDDNRKAGDGGQVVQWIMNVMQNRFRVKNKSAAGEEEEQTEKNKTKLSAIFDEVKEMVRTELGVENIDERNRKWKGKRTYEREKHPNFHLTTSPNQWQSGKMEKENKPDNDSGKEMTNKNNITSLQSEMKNSVTEREKHNIIGHEIRKRAFGGLLGWLEGQVLNNTVVAKGKPTMNGNNESEYNVNIRNKEAGLESSWGDEDIRNHRTFKRGSRIARWALRLHARRGRKEFFQNNKQAAELKEWLDKIFHHDTTTVDPDQISSSENVAPASTQPTKFVKWVKKLVHQKNTTPATTTIFPSNEIDVYA